MEKIDFEKDFKSLIEQHLPTHLSNTLQEKLAELPKLQLANKELNSKVELLSTTKKELDKEITDLRAELGALKSKELQLTLKESELGQLERELLLREIRVLNEITKREMSEKHTTDFKNVLTTVFNNKEIFENLSSSQGGQWVWDSVKGTNVFIPDGNLNTTKTTGIIKS